MKISLASDHGGLMLKNILKKYLLEKNLAVFDMGTNSEESTDYPVQGEKAVRLVQSGEADFSVLVCSTGVGMSIVANKLQGIRAVLCQDALTAKLSREHNNCNVIVFGQKIIDSEKALQCLEIFLETTYSKDLRHQRRLMQIESLKK